MFEVTKNRQTPALIWRIQSFIHHNDYFRNIRRALCLKNKTYSDAKKERMIYVDPSKIVDETHSKMGGVLEEPNLVYGGCWDKATVKFRNRVQMNSLIRHFKEGVDWTETKYYQRERYKIENGSEWRNCASINELNERFAQYDRLYKQISNEGYKTQAQLLKENEKKTEELNNEPIKAKFNEVGINIGRDGELIWQCRGQHRLCIAQILGLSEIPVQVHTRHQKWQKVRNDIKSVESLDSLEENTKKLLDHPDLQHLLTQSQPVP